MWPSPLPRFVIARRVDERRYVADDPREIDPRSIDEVRAFLDSIVGDRLEALYVLAVGTGLRQGEILGLRWADVDLDAGTLAVRHSLERGSRILAEPKTDRGRRTLTLSATVAEALREHRRHQKVVGPAAYVFTSRTSTPLDSRHVTQAFQARPFLGGGSAGPTARGGSSP